MSRAQRLILVFLAVVCGLLPILVFGMEHGGFAIPTFDEYRDMTASQQLAQIIAGLCIKPLYMLISFALIVVLIGQKTRELVALNLGLIAFLLGEVFCAINFFVYRHESLLSEYIHSYGMTLALGLATYAILETLDRRVFHIHEGKCAANELCATCKRTTPAQCAARRIAQLFFVLAIVLCFIPLSAATTPLSYAVKLFGFPYSYARLDFYQWYEIRALPLLALAFFAIGFVGSFISRNDPIHQWVKILFSAGVGALGFSMFRHTLASIFANELIWFEFWEELTELMAISAVVFFLWLFRKTLLHELSVVRFFRQRE